MRMSSVRLFTIVALLVARGAAAQHEGHQRTGDQTAAPACGQAQLVVNNIIAAARTRLETARQSNSAAEMRGAIEYADGALRDVRKHLEPCAGLVVADLHSPQRTGQPGMTSGAADAASKTKTTDPHAGHGKQAPADNETTTDKQVDPVCGLEVDPAKAAKATYAGKTYHFCSERDRTDFMKNPQKYVKKGES